jgi:phosphatidylglycerophosphate synthase
MSTDLIFTALIFLAFVESQIAIVLAIIAILRPSSSKPLQMVFQEEADEDKEAKELEERRMLAAQSQKSFSELKRQYEELVRQ